MTAESTLAAGEDSKHRANDEKCRLLDWTCVPLVTTTYGGWGDEALETLGRKAGRLATQTRQRRENALGAMMGRLSAVLLRANARALISRAGSAVGGG